MARLNRSLSIPLHAQLTAAVRDDIASGALPVGTALEHETEFAARLGVSRATVRAALRPLVDEGLLRRVRGHGTTVVAVPGDAVPSLAAFRDALLRGTEPRGHLLEVDRRSSSRVAVLLGSYRETHLWCAIVVRFSEGVPSHYVRTWMPTDREPPPRTLLMQTDITPVLQRLGPGPYTTHASVTARSPMVAERLHLRVRTNTPMLVAALLHRDVTGRPLLLEEIAQRPTPGGLTFELVGSPPAPASGT